MSDFETVPVGTMDELKKVKAECDALAALCAEAADVLDSTANDTLRGRNMADKPREMSMSDDAEFTPGPWVYRGKTGEIGVIDHSDTQSYGMLLVITHMDEFDFVEHKKNAHLITAAPDLYEALDMMMDATGPGDAAQLLAEERENIMALLAKARGEQS